MKRNLLIAILALLMPAALACGGSGGSGSVIGDGDGSLDAGFTPVQPAPGSNTAALGTGNSSGGVVGIEVTVTDVQDVYAAAFVLEYDPDVATFLGWDHGVVLEQGGQTPTYTVNQATPGQIVVGASRTGNAPAVDVAGTQSLIVLTFRLTRAGSTTLEFASKELYDSQVRPQPIPNVSWFGGSLHAN